jgi:hypothetical protein
MKEEAKKELNIKKNMTLACLDQGLARFVEGAKKMSPDDRHILTQLICSTGDEETLARIQEDKQLVEFLRILASHTWGTILISLAESLEEQAS